METLTMTLERLNETNRYLPPVRINWQGRSDGTSNSLRYHEVVQCVDLSKGITLDPSRRHFAFIGFECDEGIRRNQGRQGAIQGPIVIRNTLAPMPFLASSNTSFIDAGDVVCVDGKLEESQQVLADVITLMLEHNVQPVVVGGGHEVAWGHYQGLVKADPKMDCAIVNFDSHLDLRQPLEGNRSTSGSSFLQIAQSCEERGMDFDYTCIGVQRSANTKALLDEAKRLSVQLIDGELLLHGGWQNQVAKVNEIIDRRQKIFLSICMDVFAASVAPGVSSPQPLGIYPWDLIPLLRQFSASEKVAAFNIAEVSPPHDWDNVTARLAASLIAIFIQTNG